jgi:hypothetical protein
MQEIHNLPPVRLPRMHRSAGSLERGIGHGTFLKR